MTALLRVLSHGLKAPRAPKRLTVASLAHYKGQLRAYDSARVAAGVDPAQITRENSFLPPRKNDHSVWPFYSSYSCTPCRGR